MKQNKIFFAVFILAVFFTSSCSKQQEDLEFKQMCQDAGYEWMFMKPTQDGKFIKNAEECWGCMIMGFEHVCNKDKLMNFIPQK